MISWENLTSFQAINLILNFGVVPIIVLLWRMNSRIWELEIIIKSLYVTREEFDRTVNNIREDLRNVQKPT